MTGVLVAPLLAATAFAAAQPGEPDPSAIRWVQDHALRLSSVDPDDQGVDLRALDRVVGNARVAGFGEATHGTREFFQLKDRFFRHLVEHDGFTAFALEANFADCEAINAYVHGGPGDANALVTGLGFWTWDTEEVLALVGWMRRWNANHPEHQVSFYGIDIQAAAGNLRLVDRYLAAHDTAGSALLGPFAAYRQAATDMASGYKYTGAMTPEQGSRLREAASALFRYMDGHRPGSTNATPSYPAARSAALAVAWYFAMEGPRADLRFTGLRNDYDVRDRAMADLTEAALDRAGPGGRVFLWAHNAHVGREALEGRRRTMGSFLSEELGADYVPVGFAFGNGSFQAMPKIDASQPNVPTGLTEFRVGPVAPDHVEAVLRAGPSPAFLIDFREAAPGTPFYAWLKARRPMRWAGSDYSPAQTVGHRSVSLADSYDALAFVQRTTRARPSANSLRKRGLVRTW